ncbi:MAG: hypothetical protein Q8R15_04765 [Candidatus Micrarchaeota archaeon]|nr:hypothetical protein [Candidatus Micrarchaeota archaeon]
MILPFSEKARQAVQGQGAFLLDSDTLEQCKGFIEAVWARPPLIETTDMVPEAKKLAMCKAILSLCPYSIIARFAYNYSNGWKKFFRDNPQVKMEFASEVFPSLVQSINGGFNVNVFEFLAAEESVSLLPLSKGVVYLSLQDLSEVLANQVKRRVMSIPQSTLVPNELKLVAIELAKAHAPRGATGAKNLEKQEIRQIRLGIAEGGRYYGCMKLSRACFNDGLSFEEAKQVVLDYVKVCPQGRNPFTEKEAFTCLEWVYRKGSQRIGVQLGGNAT